MKVATAQRTRSTDPVSAVLPRLEQLSLDAAHDAYLDIAWDDPDFTIDPSDPRWEAWPNDPLAASEWYRSLPPERRRELGLLRVASVMRLGWQFENILQRGLLELVMRMPNGAAEFRYAHHEIIEESQHTLMFQEFVERAQVPATGMPRWAVWIGDRIGRSARRMPTLFFMFVLGGEAPIDHVQRDALRSLALTPLVHRIFEIHTAEEARHLSFAKTTLERDVHRLHPVKRHAVALVAPFVFGTMAEMILAPTPALKTVGRMPRREYRKIRRSREMGRFLRDSLGPTRRYLRRVGLVTPASQRVWRWLGIWDDDQRRA
jgi:hypothetical protein